MTDEIVKHHRIWRPLEWMIMLYLVTQIMSGVLEIWYMLKGAP